MGIHIANSTMEGAVTPICNSCGISLCWDISEEEYEKQKPFWDDWKCKECNPDYEGSLKKWKQQNERI